MAWRAAASRGGRLDVVMGVALRRLATRAPDRALGLWGTVRCQHGQGGQGCLPPALRGRGEEIYVVVPMSCRRRPAVASPPPPLSKQSLQAGGVTRVTAASSSLRALSARAARGWLPPPRRVTRTSSSEHGLPSHLTYSTNWFHAARRAVRLAGTGRPLVGPCYRPRPLACSRAAHLITLLLIIPRPFQPPPPRPTGYLCG